MRRVWDFHGPTKVYRLYNEAGDLLYVGVTVGTNLRFQQHQQWAWWVEVDDWTTTLYPSRRKALAAEREAIETELPRYNLQYNKNNPDRVEPRLRPPVRPRGECPGCHQTYAYTPARRYGNSQVFPASMTFHIGNGRGNRPRCSGVGKPPVGEAVLVVV